MGRILWELASHPSLPDRSSHRRYIHPCPPPVTQPHAAPKVDIKVKANVQPPPSTQRKRRKEARREKRERRAQIITRFISPVISVIISIVLNFTLQCYVVHFPSVPMSKWRLADARPNSRRGLLVSVGALCCLEYLGPRKFKIRCCPM